MTNRVTSYIKVGQNKGQARLWLESQRLAANGFAPGETYRTVLDLDARTLTLELDLFGDRRVCKRSRKLKAGSVDVPILDLCSAELTEFLGDAERVRVHYTDGKLTISLHHEDVARIERETRLQRNLSQGVIKTGTLCAGAGISTAALHDGLSSDGLRPECSWVVDSDARYLEIADRNNHAITADTHLFVGTVEEMESDLLMPVDLLNVSLPCDIHASCGKAKKGLARAEDDSSITSVFGLVSLVRSLNPSIIVSENVVEAERSSAYAMIRAELKRLGYLITESILNEQHGGALETRRRYWFVAVSSGLPAITFDQFVPEEKRFRTVREILGGEYTPEFKRYEYLDAKEARDIKAGKGFRQNIVTEDAETLGVIGKGYSKVRSTEPRLSGPDGTSRLLSVNEASRARLIPEHLLGDCSFTIGHEAGGQSILYGHGTGIGRMIREGLSES